MNCTIETCKSFCRTSEIFRIIPAFTFLDEKKLVVEGQETINIGQNLVMGLQSA